MATGNLLKAVSSNTFITSVFPFEDLCLKVNGIKVTGPPCHAISSLWGSKVAKALYHDRRIITGHDFNLVYWDGMEPVLKSFPEMFHVFVTKHVSHFCGTNKQLS